MTLQEEEIRPSLIAHDSSRVKNKIDLTDEEKKNEGVLQVASYEVAKAINRGYILVGEEAFNLIDYITATFLGLSTDDFKRTRFILINIWGIQGALKSNLAVQLIALAAGCFNVVCDGCGVEYSRKDAATACPQCGAGQYHQISAEEWKRRWTWVREMCIVNRQDLIRVGRRIQAGEDVRFPVLLLDDVNSILGRQLAWEDRDLYRLAFTCWGMIRRVVGCIITTEPNIEVIMETLKEIMNIEVIVYPGSRGNPSIPSYKAEMMCHDIHPYFRAQDKCTKIIIEEDVPFDPLSVPKSWWATYQPETTAEGRQTFGKMLDRMEELEDELIEGPSKKKEKEIGASVRSLTTVNDVEALAKKHDIKAGGPKWAGFTKDLKELQLEREQKRLGIMTGKRFITDLEKHLSDNELGTAEAEQALEMIEKKLGRRR